MIKFAALILISIITSSCVYSFDEPLLKCSEELVNKYYLAIKSHDIDMLNHIHTLSGMESEKIDWTSAFSERYSYEIIEKNIVGENDLKVYIRVKEIYPDRIVYMNFLIKPIGSSCGFISYDADEPRELNPDDMEEFFRRMDGQNQ